MQHIQLAFFLTCWFILFLYQIYMASHLHKGSSMHLPLSQFSHHFPSFLSATAVSNWICLNPTTPIFLEFSVHSATAAVNNPRQHSPSSLTFWAFFHFLSPCPILATGLLGFLHSPNSIKPFMSGSEKPCMECSTPLYSLLMDRIYTRLYIIFLLVPMN